MSIQFEFNLYTEVKRAPNDSIDGPEEIVDSKRMWMEVYDITNELYAEHFKPTVYNTSLAILPTSIYVPPYLKDEPKKRKHQLYNNNIRTTYKTRIQLFARLVILNV